MSCQLRFSSRYSKLIASKTFSDGHGVPCPLRSPSEDDGEKSDAAALWRTAAVVRNRRDVADDNDVQARSGERTHGGFAAGAGTLHANLNALHAVLVTRNAGGGKRRLLRGVGRALARALKADRACRGPAHGAAIGVGDSDLRVVERRSDVHQAVRDGAAFALFLEFFFALAGGGASFSWLGVGCCVCRFLCHFVLRFFESMVLKILDPSGRLTSCGHGAQRAAPLHKIACVNPSCR